METALRLTCFPPQFRPTGGKSQWEAGEVLRH